MTLSLDGTKPEKDVMSQSKFLYHDQNCYSDTTLMSEKSCHFFCVISSNVIMKHNCETRHSYRLTYKFGKYWTIQTILSLF